MFYFLEFEFQNKYPKLCPKKYYVNENSNVIGLTISEINPNKNTDTHTSPLFICIDELDK